MSGINVMVPHCTLDNAYGTNRCTEVFFYWKLYCYKVYILCSFLEQVFSYSSSLGYSFFYLVLDNFLYLKDVGFFFKISPCFCIKILVLVEDDTFMTLPTVFFFSSKLFQCEWEKINTHHDSVLTCSWRYSFQK